jgi:hypothetical protein
MTLPAQPDLATVLRSCAETIRVNLLPEVESAWGRYSGELCAATLDYAIGLIGTDRVAERAAGLQAAIDSLRETVTRDGDADWIAALDGETSFHVASQLLVRGQNQPGELADVVRATLHPVLHEQLDAEMNASMPIFIAFAKNISGL